MPHKDELVLVVEEILQLTLDKVILSNSRNNNKYKKAVVREVLVKEGLLYQIEQFTSTQAFHKNVRKEECIQFICDALQSDYKQCDAYCEGMNYLLKFSKKNKLFVSKKQNDVRIQKTQSHNKSKQYILQEGLFIEPLYDLGILTKEGKVIASMYDKFKQINRYIEMIDDVIHSDMTHLNIIDFGCGKSSLTFVLYYYLVEVKKIQVQMVGLDLKEQVIHDCNTIAQKYGYDHLRFEVGDINGYKAAFAVDMVISLHACDCASDYALYNALQWDAKMIFSVPCCQHEINAQIKSDRLPLLTKYGLMKERFSAMITDEMRANLLIAQGYKVQMMEFIDLAHSPKNLLIRAVKNNKQKQIKKEQAKQEVEQILQEFSLSFTLYNLLYKEN